MCNKVFPSPFFQDAEVCGLCGRFDLPREFCSVADSEAALTHWIGCDCSRWFHQVGSVFIWRKLKCTCLLWSGGPPWGPIFFFLTLHPTDDGLSFFRRAPDLPRKVSASSSAATLSAGRAVVFDSQYQRTPPLENFLVVHWNYLSCQRSRYFSFIFINLLFFLWKRLKIFYLFFFRTSIGECVNKKNCRLTLASLF